MDIREAIEHAKQHLDRDPGLAVYMLRDYPETEAAELSDLAWALSSPSNYCHKNDAAWFIEMLEAYLNKAEVKP